MSLKVIDKMTLFFRSSPSSSCFSLRQQLHITYKAFGEKKNLILIVLILKMTEMGGPGTMLCSWGFHDLTLSVDILLLAFVADVYDL